MKSSSNGSAQEPGPRGPQRNPPPQVHDYELLRVIGSGGYGEVWLARNKALQKYCAIKFVYADSFSEVAPYNAEFDGLKRYEPLSHQDGFVTVRHVGRDDIAGYFYCVMDLADDAGEAGAPGAGEVAGPVSSPDPRALQVDTYQPRTLRSDQRLLGRLPARRCLELGLSLSIVLEKLHAVGLVHRDIKPANLLFVNHQLCLGDMGLVTTIGHQTLVGTEGFRAPEGPGSRAADVYSLGMTLYTLATGLEPHPSLSLPEAWPDHDELLELNQVILKACEGDVARRYQTMTQVKTDLAYLLAGRSIRRYHFWKRLGRMALYSIPVVLLLGLTTGIVLQSRSEMLRAVKSAQAAEARVGEAGAQDRQRRLMQRNQFLRLNPHVAGWRQETLELARRAADVRRSEDLRNHAAATLLGVDVRPARQFDGVEVRHLAVSQDGRQLLIDGSTNAADGSSHEALWHWDRPTDRVRISAAPGRGPGGFLSNGLPVQLFEHPSRPLVSVLWDVSMNRPLHEFVVPAEPSVRVDPQRLQACRQISQDGSMIAVAQPFSRQSGVLCVWHTQTGGLLCQTNLSYAGAVNTLTFSPDGSLLAGGDDLGDITIWELPSGRVRARLRASGAIVHGLAFHLDKRSGGAAGQRQSWLVAAGDAGGVVTIWDLQTGEPRVHCFGSEYDVFTVAFSPDGMTLASAGRGEVRLWDRATGRHLLSIPSGDCLGGLEFSKDGGELFVGAKQPGRPGVFTVWTVDRGRGTHTLRGLRSRVSRVCFSRDGNRLAAFGHNWEVGIWDLRSDQLLRVIEVPQGIVPDNIAMAWSPDGRQFAYSTDNTSKLWDVETGNELKAWTFGKGLRETLAYAGADRLLLFRVEASDPGVGPYGDLGASGFPRVCRLRDLLSAEPERPLLEFTHFNWGVRTLTASEDGRSLLADGFRVQDGRTNRFISCWDGLSGRQLWSIAASVIEVEANPLQLDPAGGIVVTRLASEGSPAWLDARTGQRLNSRGPYFPLAIGPGGTNWVSIGLPETLGLENRGLSLFAGNANAPSITLGIDAPIASLHPVFNSNGRLLAWGQADGSVHVYDLREIREGLGELGLAWE